MVVETLGPFAQNALTLLEPFGITPTSIVSLIIRLIVVLFAWIITSKYISNITKSMKTNGKFMKSMEKMGIDERKYGVIHSLWKIGTYSVFIVFALYVLGLTPLMYTLLTAAGVMGIVIGFAVQEIASNMVSSLIIRMSQPFEKGDEIGFNGNYLGKVKDVSLYSTTVRTLEGTHLIIPNKNLITEPLVNYSINDTKMVDVTVSVLSDNDIDKALEVLENIAKKEKSRIKEELVEAYVNEIKDYMIVLELRFWVDAKEYWGVRKNIMKKILDEFKKNKIQLAIPITRTVK